MIHASNILDKIICAEQWFNNEEQRIIDGAGAIKAAVENARTDKAAADANAAADRCSSRQKSSSRCKSSSSTGSSKQGSSSAFAAAEAERKAVADKAAADAKEAAAKAAAEKAAADKAALDALMSVLPIPSNVANNPDVITKKNDVENALNVILEAQANVSTIQSGIKRLKELKEARNKRLKELEELKRDAPWTPEIDDNIAKAQQNIRTVEGWIENKKGELTTAQSTVSSAKTDKRIKDDSLVSSNITCFIRNSNSGKGSSRCKGNNDAKAQADAKAVVKEGLLAS